MKVITSGSRYIDIDAYASCIAYSYFLNLKGISSKAISTAKLNESIKDELLDLESKLDSYIPKENDEFIIIDVSDKDYFDNVVNKDNIIQVIDHHTGFEKYWKERLNENCKIEFIGAVATIIFELYEKENLQNKLPQDIIKLLMSAILDNTLNFKAKVTSDRDRIAYSKLEELMEIKENYVKEYFMSCQRTIEKDFEKALKNDTKIGIISNKLPDIFSQLVVWDKKNILDNKEKIYDILNTFGQNWLLNLICLKDGKSYIITSNDLMKDDIKKLIDIEVENDYYLECKDIWLRKEIIKKAEEDI